MRPGCSRPFATTWSGGTSSTPVSTGQHDAVVGGLPPAGRAQAVAVEHRADQRAVGERDAGRAVPRLHQARVELVERPALRVHRGVVLPRLRDHHQHRVRQAAAAEVQQLQHLVERRRVRAVRVADREQPGEVAGDEIAVQQRLTGAHTVAVAADGVDLTVVRDEPERVRERPRGERVRGETAVHQRDRACRAARRAGRGRTPAAARSSAFPCRRSCAPTATGSTAAATAPLVLDPLAQAEGEPVQLDPGLVRASPGTNEHREVRHHRQRGRADVRPSPDRPARRASRARSRSSSSAIRSIWLDGLGRSSASNGQESDSRRVGCPSRPGRSNSTTARRNSSGSCRRMPAPSPRGLGARGATVLQVRQCCQRVDDDAVGTPALDVGHHGDATRVALSQPGRKDPGGRGWRRRSLRRPPSSSSLKNNVLVLRPRTNRWSTGRRWPAC